MRSELRISVNDSNSNRACARPGASAAKIRSYEYLEQLKYFRACFELNITEHVL